MADQHRNEGSGDRQTNAPDIKGTLNLRGTIEIPVQRGGGTDRSKGEIQAHRKHTTFEVVTKIIEIGAALLVGGALVGVGLLQWGVYSQQADIMRTQGSAYVLPQGISGSYDTDTTTKIRKYYFWTVLKNSGMSLAKITFSYINFLYPTDEIPKDYDFRNIIGLQSKKFIIGPQGESRTMNAEIAPNFIEEMRQHKRQFYIYGSIIYDDRYSKGRVTMYCSQLLTVTARVADGETIFDGFGFVPCERHNCIRR